MSMRTGSASLPLHGGRVPAWLASRMARLGRVIVEAIVHDYGRDELLRRLASPFWFQSFGAVMGMDWHSSGITTSVIGALKRGLQPVQHELGLYVCGGRGAHARRTPWELAAVGERTGIDAAALATASRLVAKIDDAAVQDGYALYLHGFIVTGDARWCVVQQGMNDARREARRYHWLSEGLSGYFDSPHAAVAGRNLGAIVNLADRRAAHSRRAGLALVAEGPARTIALLRDMAVRASPMRDLFEPTHAHRSAAPASLAPHLSMPHHHEVWASDLLLRRLHATLQAAAERGPQDFSELLLTPGIGARTVAALAFVSEVVHGAPSRFSDPARYSLAHGGKDGHPFPVPLRVYDQTIATLKRALASARLGNEERLGAIRRLDQQARAVEGRSRGVAFETHLAAERARSDELGGRTV